MDDDESEHYRITDDQQPKITATKAKDVHNPSASRSLGDNILYVDTRGHAKKIPSDGTSQRYTQ